MNRKYMIRVKQKVARSREWVKRCRDKNLWNKSEKTMISQPPTGWKEKSFHMRAIKAVLLELAWVAMLDLRHAATLISFDRLSSPQSKWQVSDMELLCGHNEWWICMKQHVRGAHASKSTGRNTEHVACSNSTTSPRGMKKEGAQGFRPNVPHMDSHKQV